MIRSVCAILLALIALYPLSPVRGAATASTPSSLRLPVLTGNDRLDYAERVALGVLSRNEHGGVHRAAPYYIDPWVRDSYAWGMIPDDHGTLATYARSELQYWLRRQKPFGGWVTFQYSGWYDETAIMIAAVLDAYRLTGDRRLVLRALPALRKAWNWLHGSYVYPWRGSGCLLWVDLRPQGKHWAADWADQVARRGYTPQLEGLWYQATYAMAALESIAGHRRAAQTYTRAASCIDHDINRLLWSVGSPLHYNVHPLAPFGHYRARPGGDYLELDANALLIALGLANKPRAGRVLGVVMAQQHYFLGRDGGGPARVLYGDYAQADYALIHNWMAPGRYQSAYWPSVGGLLALAAARNNATTTALVVLEAIAARNAGAESAFHEWYTPLGRPRGAADYSWGARMYLLALYRAYLGVDDPDMGDLSTITHPADLLLRAAPAPARGELVRLGKHITIITYGKGAFRYARLGRRILRSPLIPARLLYDGAVLTVYRG